MCKKKTQPDTDVGVYFKPLVKHCFFGGPWNINQYFISK